MYDTHLSRLNSGHRTSPRVRLEHLVGVATQREGWQFADLLVGPRAARTPCPNNNSGATPASTSVLSLSLPSSTTVECQQGMSCCFKRHHNRRAPGLVGALQAAWTRGHGGSKSGAKVVHKSYLSLLTSVHCQWRGRSMLEECVEVLGIRYGPCPAFTLSPPPSKVDGLHCFGRVGHHCSQHRPKRYLQQCLGSTPRAAICLCKHC